MALIRCPECYKNVSDTAECCPYCGMKISGTENLIQLSLQKKQQITQNRSNSMKKVVATISVIAVVGLLIFARWYNSTSLERDKKELRESVEDYKETQKEIADIETQIKINEYLIDKYSDD